MNPTRRITTRSLVLRPLVAGDARRLLDMSREACARRWLPSQVLADDLHAAKVLDHLVESFDLAASPRTNAFVFGVEEQATGRLVGHVGLSPLVDAVEVGFGLETTAQGKGYAREGVAAACAWGLKTFSLPAILGVTDAENIASQRVLTGCGFCRTAEKTMVFQGAERPVVLFEIRNRSVGA